MHEDGLFWCCWAISFPRGSRKLGCSRFVTPPVAGAFYHALKGEQARSTKQTLFVLLDKFDFCAVEERGFRKQVVGARMLSLL